jgi:hypothetical protein
MSRLQSLLRFIWDFVIGDDWRIAAGVALALVATAAVADTAVAAWWILPLAVLALLGFSIWRAARAQVSPSRYSGFRSGSAVRR